MGKRTFLQLAYNYRPGKDNVGGWCVSIKLDGMRAAWDGGVTRGKLASEVQWANTVKDKKEVTCTGLWSRGGKVIYAPDWWLDQMPTFPCDGELYIGVNKFQETMKIVRRHTPDAGWEKITFQCFGVLRYNTWLEDGEIKNSTSAHNVVLKNAYLNVRQNYPMVSSFENDVFKEVKQTPLPKKNYEEKIAELLTEVEDLGGEGLMLRHPRLPIEHCRSHLLLKVKSFDDDEGIVIGYTWGRETDKGSKLAGLMGALEVQYGDVTFLLSGFTEAEREMSSHRSDVPPDQYGVGYAGERVHKSFFNPLLPIGSIVRFKFIGKTKDQIPKFAKFWR